MLPAGRVLLALPDFRLRPQAAWDALWLAAAVPALGAIAVLSYPFASRSVARLPGIGPYVAGVVTVSAYLGTMVRLVAASGEELDTAKWMAIRICTLIFSLVVVRQFFPDDSASSAP